MIIDSTNNKKVLLWSKLKQKKYRNETNTFLVEGEHHVIEALAAGLAKEIITTTNKIYDKNIIHYNVTDKVMKKISELTNPIDVAAVCIKKTGNISSSHILLIDKVQDPGNMGTIIRSSVAFNYDIILNTNTVDIYNSKVIRASEGMIFKANIITNKLENSILDLKQDGYKIVGTDVKSGCKISDIKSQKIALLIGNEGSGVDKELLEKCDNIVNIKMNPLCESLNVAVAGSILMYELGEYHG